MVGAAGVGEGFNMSEHNVSEIFLSFVVRFNHPTGSATLQLPSKPPVGSKEAGVKYILGYGDSRDKLYRLGPFSYEEAKGHSPTGKFLYIAIVKDDKTLKEELIDTEREWPPTATGSDIVDRNYTIWG